MIQSLQRLINALCSKGPTRVVERQMDGCMAEYMSREDYGTVIGHDTRYRLTALDLDGQRIDLPLARPSAPRP